MCGPLSQKTTKSHKFGGRCLRFLRVQGGKVAAATERKKKLAPFPFPGGRSWWASLKRINGFRAPANSRNKRALGENGIVGGGGGGGGGNGGSNLKGKGKVDHHSEELWGAGWGGRG